MRPSTICLLSCLALPIAASPAPPGSSGPLADDVDTIVDELRTLRDEAEVDRIWDLAEIETRAAALGLADVYDVMGSLFMRREVIRALANYDGVLEAEGPALQKLVSIATTTREAEVRDWALQSIAACKFAGKAILAQVVESPANDLVRELAMERHLELADPRDYDWYRQLVWPRSAEDEEEDGKRKKRASDDDEEAAPKVRRLGKVRELAFQGLVPALTDAELIHAASDPRRAIRVLAIEELGRRRVEDARELILERFERVDQHYEVRTAAARVLAEGADKKLIDDFVDEGTRGPTPRTLRYALADIIAEHGDEKLHAKLVRKLGKGKDYEKLFLMRALRDVADEKVDKALRKMLVDKDLEVRIAAAELLGARKAQDEDTVEALQKMLEKADDELTTQVGLAALSDILGTDSDWIGRLEAYAAGDVLLVRNAALRELARQQGAAAVDLLVHALEHPDWSTRLTAARALAELRVPAAVGALIDRLDDEEGLQLSRFLELLFELTGQPFGRNLSAWRSWWKAEGADFEVISAKELRERREERELRRLKQVTFADSGDTEIRIEWGGVFLGIKTESRRVIFIIDVSGSMNEMVPPTKEGEKPEPRLDFAKRELIESIDALDDDTLFNVIAFSGGVMPWLDGDLSESADLRDEAKEFVQRLGSGGGTNLYGALEAAFADPGVDTIFVLSDGEPSVGEVFDPEGIREHVQLWNEHRGVLIHCIAVGGSFQVLEWLAEDSGGSYVRI